MKEFGAMSENYFNNVYQTIKGKYATVSIYTLIDESTLLPIYAVYDEHGNMLYSSFNINETDAWAYNYADNGPGWPDTSL